jgi:hypothetical protein
MGAGHMAQLYAEMSVAVAEGKLVFEPGVAITRGTTDMRATLAKLLG